MAKKSARDVRSLRRNRVRTRSWTQKGTRTNPVVKQEATHFISQLDQTTMDNIPLSYTHIECNEYINRGHKQLLEDDIPICSCKVIKGDPESTCGDHCLNFITSNECTPGFCPCGELCKNQRFQQKKYAKTKLVKTNERGWGLLADQDIKMGEFIMEYCGEVISSEEAKARSQAYQLEGMQDSYIISLSGSEFIDATKKGSFGRFINHSCEPNCETRKWTVLGEVRVGIFAKQNIDCATELTYNYNFEWYGGAKIRCLCGAASCVGFLGAKSRGFQADSYVWDDNDERYSVENVPLYDSDDDEPLVSFFKRAQVCNKLKKPVPKAVLDAVPEDAGTESIQIEELFDILDVKMQEEADFQNNITVEQKCEENNVDINISIKKEPVSIDEINLVKDTKSEDRERTNPENKEKSNSRENVKAVSEDKEGTNSEYMEKTVSGGKQKTNSEESEKTKSDDSEKSVSEGKEKTKSDDRVKAVAGVEERAKCQEREKTVAVVEERAKCQEREKTVTVVEERAICQEREKTVAEVEERAKCQERDKTVAEVEEKAKCPEREKTVADGKERAKCQEREKTVSQGKEISKPDETEKSVSQGKEKSKSDDREKSVFHGKEKSKSDDREKSVSHGKEKSKSDDRVKTVVESKERANEKTKSENKENKKKRRAVPALDVRKRLVTRKSGVNQKKPKENSNAYYSSPVDNRSKIETVCRYFPHEAAREELQNAENREAEAVSELKKLNEELRPVIEDLGKDGPDSLPIGKAEEWISVMCKQLTATFDFNYLVIKKLSSAH